MTEAASSGLSGSARSGDRQGAGDDLGSARLRRGEISGEGATIAATLGAVARARGMAEVARSAYRRPPRLPQFAVDLLTRPFSD
ncbi:MAG: hypothetical protein ACLPSW_13690 [Roseiarcus sp.]